jgi:opacity protein-like surface antigen
MHRLSIAAIAAVSVFALAQSASAADLGRKPIYKAPPPQPPAPVYSWTGFYIGGDLGVRSTQTDLTTDAFAFVGPPLPLIPKPQRPSG